MEERAAVERLKRGDIGGRVSGERISGPRLSEAHIGEEHAESSPRRRWLPQLVPSTPLGYALAVLSVLILAVGVYAASGPVRELSRQGLPGGVASDTKQTVPDEWIEDLLRQTVPEIREANLDVRVNETQTVGGITVALERAYADEGNVVIVYSASGWDNQAAPTSGLSMAMLADESGATFESVGNLGVSTDPMLKSVEVGREAWVDILDPSEKLEVSGSHAFRVRMKLDPSPRKSDRRDDGPAEATKLLTFHFSIPVHNMDVIDVGQTVETNGIRMTLDRVENSPARSEAFLCFDPPQDEKYNWSPWVKRPTLAQSDLFINDSLLDIEPKEAVGCLGYDLFRSLYDKVGVHSFTVTKIEGRTRAEAYPERTIRGPWTFEFEVPDL